MKPFAKILCAIDFSACSDKALEAAIDVAARYQASLALVYVNEPIPLAFPEGTGIYETLQLPNMVEEMTKELEKRAQDVSTKTSKHVDAVFRNGYPPNEITELAKSGGFDLIVMGTHGRRGLAHLMIGSVAERVVRAAPCPVLTVR